MNTFILLIILLFTTVLQAAIPYLVKSTIVFGVSIPEQYTTERPIIMFKKLYCIIILISGGLLMLIVSVMMGTTSLSDATKMMLGVSSQFVVLFISMFLYLFLHAKVNRLKHQHQWSAPFKQLRITDLAIRAKDEMLPTVLFIAPMLITIGLIGYTSTRYGALPNNIPIHWGPSGQPDAFTTKTPFTAVSLLVILFILQTMFLTMHYFIQQSGIRTSAVRIKSSQIQKLAFRKYTSWLLFFIVVLVTILFSFFQLTIIHPDIVDDRIMFSVPFAFLMLTLIATGIYAFKAGQSGTRIGTNVEEPVDELVMDVDEDCYWKLGVFYVNRQDPSIFVEKRFGVGWTINFANPIGILITILPVLVIILISLLL